ncbi:MAG TPA: hypothetical protein PLI70_00700 [Gemmatimonadales bacterium]|nr:hypothetical protein [Gemmatimonadales bacterium]HRZ09978.1 hypothetical protein [Gemmatimonadales bacterium]
MDPSREEVEVIDVPAFSLCEGGRLQSALTKSGLSGGARGRGMLIGMLLVIGWLPLVVLSAAAGTAVGGVDHPLFSDLGTWARFLVVVPIMIMAEPAADRILGIVVELFRRAGLVREPDLPAFEAAVVRTQRLATSDTAELVLLLTALALPHLLVASLPHLGSEAAWFGSVVEGRTDISGAGRWYAWVSLPLVQFLMLRWLWRIVCWWGLVWRISRLDLAWAASHPDGAGGIGFLAWSPRAFRTVFLGFSALAAATVSNRIQYGGESLLDARGPIVAFIVCECMLLLAPQFFFVGGLVKARYSALAGYGLTGIAMTREFDRHWTAPPPASGAKLLDSGQSSAMIDYTGVYGQVKAMRPVAISLREVAGILLPVAAPFAPLLLYQYSLKEILQSVVQLVR